MPKRRAVVATCVLFLCALDAPASAQSPPPIPVVTSDLVNFYRAMDRAEGSDSATRVRIFEQDYLRAGSRGLIDWALLRLTDFNTALKPLFDSPGWTMQRAVKAYFAPEGDRDHDFLVAALDTLVPPHAAVTIAAFTAKHPKFFAEIRGRILALDSSQTFRAAAQAGLGRVQALYPDARLKPVYIVVGRLTAGGTAGASGMLLGAEMATKGDSTPLDELTVSDRTMVTARSLDAWVLLIAHEAVHTLQPRDERSSLLFNVLHEGIPDFVASLAVPAGTALQNPYQRYGRANEARVWREFERGMRSREPAGNWLYSYDNPKNHGAPDLGYFIGFRIAEAYYQRATDKAAAIRELIALRNPQEILRRSRYGTQWSTARVAKR